MRDSDQCSKPIEVRVAHVEDAEEIAACLADAFEPFRPRYTREAFKDTVPTPEAIQNRMACMPVYVALGDDAKILGTLAAGFNGTEGHLRGMAVRPQWHGHGIAEKLLARAEMDLLAAGCSHVTLDTTIPLERAVGFYNKNGYIPSGRVTDFFGMRLYEFVKQLVRAPLDRDSE